MFESRMRSLIAWATEGEPAVSACSSRIAPLLEEEIVAGVAVELEDVAADAGLALRAAQWSHALDSAPAPATLPLTAEVGAFGALVVAFAVRTQLALVTAASTAVLAERGPTSKQ